MLLTYFSVSLLTPIKGYQRLVKRLVKVIKVS